MVGPEQRVYADCPISSREARFPGMLTPALCSVIDSGLSSGRLQSTARRE